MPASSVTLRDVANEVGVHFSTVSLALRGDQRIALATRERVREVAKRLGYQPNPAAQALVRRRQGISQEPPTIAYLVSSSTAARSDRAAYRAEVLAGARAQARLLGFRFKVYTVPEATNDADDLEGRLKRDGVECVILSLFLPGGGAPPLDWERYCSVRIDSQHVEPSLHTVSTDRIHNVRLAYRSLRSEGLQRIGLCVGRWQEDSTRQRHSMGYLMEESALGPQEGIAPLVLPSRVGPSQWQRLVSAWLKRHRPQAVLHDGCWLGVMPEERRPDLRVVNLNGLASRTKESGVEAMPRIVGEKAVAAVAMLLRMGARGTPRLATDTYVEGRWRDG